MHCWDAATRKCGEPGCQGSRQGGAYCGRGELNFAAAESRFNAARWTKQLVFHTHTAVRGAAPARWRRVEVRVVCIPNLGSRKSETSSCRASRRTNQNAGESPHKMLHAEPAPDAAAFTCHSTLPRERPPSSAPALALPFTLSQPQQQRHCWLWGCGWPSPEYGQALWILSCPHRAY